MTAQTYYRVTLTRTSKLGTKEVTEARFLSLAGAVPTIRRTLEALSSDQVATSYLLRLDRMLAPGPLVISGARWVLTTEWTTPTGTGCPWNVHPGDAECILPADHAGDCRSTLERTSVRQAVTRGIIRPTPPGERHDFRPVVVEGLVIAGCTCSWDELSGRAHRIA